MILYLHVGFQLLEAVEAGHLPELPIPFTRATFSQQEKGKRVKRQTYILSNCQGGNLCKVGLATCIPRFELRAFGLSSTSAPSHLALVAGRIELSGTVVLLPRAVLSYRAVLAFLYCNLIDARRLLLLLRAEVCSARSGSVPCVSQLQKDTVDTIPLLCRSPSVATWLLPRSRSQKLVSKKLDTVINR